MKYFFLFVSLALLFGGGFVVLQKDTDTKSQTPSVIQEVKQKIVEKTVPITPTPDRVILPGAKWVPQSFNNCGPASVSMVLQYFGYNVSQETTKAALRTNPTDSNVFTYEIKDYLKGEYDIDSELLYNGDEERLKTLLANGFYILIEDYLHPNDEIGHFTIIRGYDDTKGVFIADDSYLGTDIEYPYAQFDEYQWKPFNREYLPVFKPEKRALLEAIVGEDMNLPKMYQKAIERNKADIAKNDSDMYAYFNVGVSYYNLGEYEKAQAAFEKSQTIGWPKLMLWYQIQPIQTLNKLERFNEALNMSNIALSDNDGFSEVHVEKAKAYIGLGQKEQARFELEKALNSYPNMKAAESLLSTL